MDTKTITGSGREDFKDKTILILGGGDGGILNELLQCSPKFVTMVDVSFQLFRTGAVDLISLSLYKSKHPF